MCEYEYEYVAGADFTDGCRIKFEKSTEPSLEKIGSCITPERGSENLDDSGSPLFYTCSVCGRTVKMKYDFCLDCGTPMDTEEVS